MPRESELQIRDDMKPGYYLAFRDGHFVGKDGGVNDAEPRRFINIAAARLAAKEGQRVVEVA